MELWGNQIMRKAILLSLDDTYEEELISSTGKHKEDYIGQVGNMNANINDIHDEDIRECLQIAINYIVKLERENLGLKEYKKHQERANERRYRSGEESWHRGAVVTKKK